MELNEKERKELRIGISLARGHTQEEAETRIKRIENLMKEVERIEEWITENRPPGQGGEATMLLLFAKILDKYRIENKEKLIRGLYKIAITDAYEIANQAQLIRTMGQKGSG